MLFVFAMKCCTKMPCPLPHRPNHYCCLLSSPICLSHLLICTCVISSPIACPPSSVLGWCLFRFFLFLIYATFLCDSILDCLCTYFCLIVFFIPFHFGCVFLTNTVLHTFHDICIFPPYIARLIWDGCRKKFLEVFVGLWKHNTRWPMLYTAWSSLSGSVGSTQTDDMGRADMLKKIFLGSGYIETPVCGSWNFKNY